MGFRHVLSGPLVRSSYHADVSDENSAEAHSAEDSTHLMFLDLENVITLGKMMDDLKVTDADEHYEDLLAAFKEAYKVGRPAAVYSENYVETVSAKETVIDGVVFDGPLIAEKLSEVHRVFPYAATCETALAQRAEKITDPLIRYYADMLNQKAAGLMAGRILTEVKAQTGIEKLASINPGSLPAWPVDQQKPLFELLGEKTGRIGISLSESCLMIPVKSVSGILFASSAEWFNCMRCSRKNCPGRQAPCK